MGLSEKLFDVNVIKDKEFGRHGLLINFLGRENLFDAFFFWSVIDVVLDLNQF